MGLPFYQFVTTTTNAGDGLYVPDWYQTPFDLSYCVEVPAGVTASFLLQYSLDDVNDPSWVPVWLPDPTNGVARAVTIGGFYSFRIRALRLNVATLTGGAARVRFAVLQGQSSR